MVDLPKHLNVADSNSSTNLFVFVLSALLRKAASASTACRKSQNCYRELISNAKATSSKAVRSRASCCGQPTLCYRSSQPFLCEDGAGNDTVDEIPMAHDHLHSQVADGLWERLEAELADTPTLRWPHIRPILYNIGFEQFTTNITYFSTSSELWPPFRYFGCTPNFSPYFEALHYFSYDEPGLRDVEYFRRPSASERFEKFKATTFTRKNLSNCKVIIAASLGLRVTFRKVPGGSLQHIPTPGQGTRVFDFPLKEVSKRGTSRPLHSLRIKGYISKPKSSIVHSISFLSTSTRLDFNRIFIRRSTLVCRCGHQEDFYLYFAQLSKWFSSALGGGALSSVFPDHRCLSFLRKNFK